MRDPESGNSKGFAFVNFASFEASDAAMEAMNGQYLCNRPISVSYAFKKDAKGERHGTASGELTTLLLLACSCLGNPDLGLCFRTWPDSFCIPLVCLFQSVSLLHRILSFLRIVLTSCLRMRLRCRHLCRLCLLLLEVWPFPFSIIYLITSLQIFLRYAIYLLIASASSVFCCCFFWSGRDPLF